MKENFMFTIIVPAYQVEQYIENCINSIENQSFRNYEIIVIDDGSTDMTPQICDNLSNVYKNVKVIHTKNNGLSEARNYGIKHATGKYCIFVDSDDFLCEDSLVNLANYIISQNDVPDIILTRRMTYDCINNKLFECAYIFDEIKMSKLSVAEQYRTLWRLPECILGVWIFCVKMDYLRENNLLFYKGIFHEDEEWVPRVFFNTQKIKYFNYPLYCYRINREKSITSTSNIKRIFDKLLIVDLIQKEFNKKKYSFEIKKTMMMRTHMIIFGTLVEYKKYKKDKSIYKLEKIEMQKYKSLRLSEKKIHRITYYGIKIFGLNFITNILWKIKGHKI